MFSKDSIGRAIGILSVCLSVYSRLQPNPLNNRNECLHVVSSFFWGLAMYACFVHFYFQLVENQDGDCAVFHSVRLFTKPVNGLIVSRIEKQICCR